MPKKPDYAALFTLRADGRYMGYWHELDRAGEPKGPRHAIYDRDPERLLQKIQEKELPKELRKETFRETAERWEDAYRETVTERTWANFRPHYENLVSMWGNIPTAEITAQDIIADLQRAKAQGLSRTVVNSRKVIITGILNQALADGVVPFNAAVSVRLPKGLKQGRRSAPGDDVILKVCEHREDPFGFFPFLLLCTGLRKSEALALHRDDIDPQTGKNRQIHVRRSLTYIDNANPAEKLPKSGKPRTVPLPEVLAGPLDEYLAQLRGPLLFPQPGSNRGGKGGSYMSERAYEGAWLRWCVGAGLVDGDGKPIITAHHLRHATATLLFEAGVDVYTAQAILGHSRVSTTMEIYTELRQQQQSRSVERYSARLSELLSKEKSKA